MRAQIQEATAPATQPVVVLRDNEGFLGWHLALLLFLPMALLALLSWRRAKSRRLTIAEFRDATFGEQVLAQELPVLVHFFRAWSIADQVVIAQIEMLAKENQGRLVVGWLDMDRNPAATRLLEPLESPAVVLFAHGRKLYQRGGLFMAVDLQKDLDRVLAAASSGENEWRRLAEPPDRD